jgi:hypothetical protein
LEKIQPEKPEIIALIKTFRKRDGDGAKTFIEEIKEKHISKSRKDFENKKITTFASESHSTHDALGVALVEVPFDTQMKSLRESFEDLWNIGILPIDARGTHALIAEHPCVLGLHHDMPITVLGSHVVYKNREHAKNVEPFVSQIARGAEDDFRVIQKSFELFLQEKRPTFILALVNNAVIKKAQKPIVL